MKATCYFKGSKLFISAINFDKGYALVTKSEKLDSGVFKKDISQIERLEFIPPDKNKQSEVHNKH